MSSFIVKPSTLKELLPLYQACFNSVEFVLNLMGEETLDLSSYVGKGSNIIRLIVSRAYQDEVSQIGFCHFVNQGNDEYFFSGGCLPDLFDQGVGLKASIHALLYLFDNFEVYRVNTNVYFYNGRSLKMLKAIGFRSQFNQGKSEVLATTKEDFYSNRLVQYIINR